MISLSRRITIAMVAAVSLCVGLASMAVWMISRWHAVSILDHMLAEHLHTLDLLQARRGGRLTSGHFDVPTLLGRTAPGMVAVIVDRDTRQMLMHSGISAPDGERVLEAAQGLAMDVPVWVTLPSNHPARLICHLGSPPPPLLIRSRPLIDPPPVYPGPYRSEERALPGGPPPWWWLHRDDGAPSVSASGSATGATGASAVAPPAASPWFRVQLPPVHHHQVLVVAEDAQGDVEELARLAGFLIAVWLTATGMALFAAWGVQRAILNPVRQLAEAIRAIDPEDLAHRLQVPVPVEMAVVPARLDELLQRLTVVLEREKRTIADIAHELRTPIAGLRTTLEFALARPGAGLGRADAERLLHATIGMQSMVVKLLTLTRLEAGLERVVAEEVDLAALARRCLLSLEDAADAKGQSFDASGLREHSLVPTSSEHVRLVVQNLIDNAVSHGQPGAIIAVSLQRRPGQVVLSVANPTAAAFTAPQHWFQPFYRGDRVRGGDGLHCGLGLVLCQRLATLLRGSIALRLDTPGRFVAEVILPDTWPGESSAQHLRAAVTFPTS